MHTRRESRLIVIGKRMLKGSGQGRGSVVSGRRLTWIILEALETSMVLGLSTQLQNTEAKVIKSAHVKVQEPGRVYMAANAIPVHTEDTPCVKLIGTAESSNCKAQGIGGLGRQRG
jgi:hypothetical protein